MITKIGTDLVGGVKSNLTSSQPEIKDVIPAVAGVGLLSNAVRSGDLTGRRTLYHGTTEDVVKSIMDKGLLPTTDETAVNMKGIAYDKERYKKSLGKAYATPSKQHALMYAMNARNRKAGNFLVMDPVNRSDIRGIVKLNVPDWKYKMVLNPEVDMGYEEWLSKIEDSARRKLNPSEKSRYKNIYKHLRGAAVFEGGVSPEHIKGSNKYTANSLKEILEYARARPSRFARGTGKGIAGLGAIVGSAYLLSGKNNNWNRHSLNM